MNLSTTTKMSSLYLVKRRTRASDRSYRTLFLGVDKGGWRNRRTPLNMPQTAGQNCVWEVSFAITSKTELINTMSLELLNYTMSQKGPPFIFE